MSILPLILAGVLFTVNPETGLMEVTQSGVENPSDDLFQSEVGEEKEDGLYSEDTDWTGSTGDSLQSQEDLPESKEELDSNFDSDSDSAFDSVLDDETLVLIQSELELLANAVVGNINSSVLDLMDRIINGLPSDYKYIGYRTSTTDAYLTELYIGKKATVANNNTVLFEGDCVRVDFRRNTTNNQSYIYYTVSSAPNSVVSINSNVVYYTNCVEYHPTLGQPVERGYNKWGMVLAVALFGTVVFYVWNRRKAT